MRLLKSLRLDGFLSFPPKSEAIELTPLNVLIGPNGSGKSNLIEAVELLHNTPTSTFSDMIFLGGGAQEWIWKGEGATHARIEAIAYVQPQPNKEDLLVRYNLSFKPANQQVEIFNESITSEDGLRNYYGLIHELKSTEKNSHEMQLSDFWQYSTQESALSQVKDPLRYPELTNLGKRFGQIQTFREWSFGRSSHLRQPQSAALPTHPLLPRSENLGLLLSSLHHVGAMDEFNHLLSRFLPRYRRLTTLVQGGSVQIFLHEHGLNAPISATRLSDGTTRFLAMLALLLSPNPPPLLCIEEPELGLHPDAVAMLAAVMVEASARMQIIVTTHSDALVSAFTEQTDSVLVCEHRNGSVLRRLDSEKLRYLLDEHTLGEIWRMGELGGNPCPNVEYSCASASPTPQARLDK